jgi:Carboxypeptidase regulatory-like domain
MRAAAILFCILPLLAQEQVPSKTAADRSATASVAGQVVRADTGEPLKKAQVGLWSNEQQTSYQAVTDVEGRFQIIDVKPGRYRLWAGRDGYVTASYGEKPSRRRTPTTILGPGQQLRDVVFRLQRTAVITGRVVNEDGEPMPEVEVTLFARQAGLRQRMMRPPVRTNDLGEYRIFRIDPGKYYLSAAPPNRTTELWDVVSTSDQGEERKSEKKNESPIYAPLFYPATTDFDQAARLAVKGGDELRVDFTFAPAQVYSVRGRVLGAVLKTKEPLVVMLASPNAGGMNQQAARVRNDGTYEIYPVLPGSYRLAVSTGPDYNPMMQSTAKIKVEVTNTDLENVDLTASAARKTEIKGRLMVEGEPSAKLDKFALSLVDDGEEDDEFSQRTSARVNADGSFSFESVSAGTYSIQVHTIYGSDREYYVKSGRFGSRDLPQSSFNVTEASSPRLELVLSSSTARLEGVVVDDKDRPVPGATVVAVPASKFKNLNYWYPDGVTDNSGRFVLPRLRPGDYQLVAFEDADYMDALDPAALERTENAGAKAQAQAGSTATVKVKVIATPQDKQPRNERP